MKTRVPLTQAEAPTPGGDQIAIAGSIRRQVAAVADIEIVAIPTIQPAHGAMVSLIDRQPTATESALDSVIESLIADKPHFRRKDKNGPKYKNFEIDTSIGPIQLDLFITTINQWGPIFAIRTGSERFSKRLVTQRGQGGLMPLGFRMIDGWLTDRGQRVEMHSERGMLELCGGWVEPWER